MSVVQVKRETTLLQNNVQINKIERHHHWHLKCSAKDGCCCCNYYYCWLFFMTVAILACALIPLSTLDDDDSGGGGGDGTDDMGYYDNETRLMKVSAFFRDKVELTADSSAQFHANATLYLVQETPQLKPGFYINDFVKVQYDPDDPDFDDNPAGAGVQHNLHYLKTNSTITYSACIPSDCDPFYLFIMKSHEFHKWSKSPSTAPAGLGHQIIKKDCSEGYNYLNYTVTDDTFYYFVTYATTSCSTDDDDAYDKRTTNLVINRFEYSVNSVTVTDSCKIYDQPSCSLKVPLGSGYAKALVTVGGDGYGGYDLSFSTSSRMWAYCVVVIPTLCLLLVPIVCCVWCCVTRRRTRRSTYNRL